MITIQKTEICPNGLIYVRFSDIVSTPSGNITINNRIKFEPGIYPPPTFNDAFQIAKLLWTPTIIQSYIQNKKI